MKLFIALLALLFLVGVGDCRSGYILPPPPPEDNCFEGTFANSEFSLVMDYDSGQVRTTVIKPATSTSPWEGMSFIGNITETGRAVGVLRLNYPDDYAFEEWDYSIYLEPVTGECNARNTLRLPLLDFRDSSRGPFSHTLTRQP